MTQAVAGMQAIRKRVAQSNRDWLPTSSTKKGVELPPKLDTHHNKVQDQWHRLHMVLASHYHVVIAAGLLVGTSASLLVTSALLVVTRGY